MAIAFVADLGISQVAAGNPVITLAATVPVGDHIVIAYATNGATALTALAITDTGGNTYQTDRLHDDGTGALHIGIASARVTTQLVSGNTITVTPTGGGAQRTACAAQFSGLATTAWLDAVNSGNATSTAPSSGNLLDAGTGELMIGDCAYNLAFGGYAPGATGGSTPIELRDVAIGTAGAKSIEFMYLLGTSGTVTANGTIVSAVWVQGGATYKEAAAATVTPPPPVVVDFAVQRAANY